MSAPLTPPRAPFSSHRQVLGAQGRGADLARSRPIPPASQLLFTAILPRSLRLPCALSRHPPAPSRWRSPTTPRRSSTQSLSTRSPATRRSSSVARPRAAVTKRRRRPCWRLCAPRTPAARGSHVSPGRPRARPAALAPARPRATASTSQRATCSRRGHRAARPPISASSRMRPRPLPAAKPRRTYSSTTCARPVSRSSRRPNGCPSGMSRLDRHVCPPRLSPRARPRRSPSRECVASAGQRGRRWQEAQARGQAPGARRGGEARAGVYKVSKSRPPGARCVSG